MHFKLENFPVHNDDQFGTWFCKYELPIAEITVIWSRQIFRSLSPKVQVSSKGIPSVWLEEQNTTLEAGNKQKMRSPTACFQKPNFGETTAWGLRSIYNGNGSTASE